MSMTNNPVIIAVFQDASAAQKAATALRGSGFASVNITHSEKAAPRSSGFLTGLKRMFGGDETGSILDSLRGAGASEEEAQFYEQEYEAGRTLLTVKADGNRQKALAILQRYNAYDASTRPVNQVQARATDVVKEHTTTSSAQVKDTVTTDSTHIGSTTTTESAQAESIPSPASVEVNDLSDRHSIRLREEQLDVSTEKVQTGEVTLHKEVVTEHKTLAVPVTSEEVVIEQRPGSGKVSDTPIGRDEVIDVPVRVERIEVTKTPVVTGEVALEKRTVQETQHVSDTVRKEQVSVEQEGNAPIHGTPSDHFHPQSQRSHAVEQSVQNATSKRTAQPRSRKKKR